MTWSPKSRRSSTDPRYDPAPAGSFFRAAASLMPPRGKGAAAPYFGPVSRSLPRPFHGAGASPALPSGAVLYSECAVFAVVLPASLPVSRRLRESWSALRRSPVFRVRCLCCRPACFLACSTAPARVLVCPGIVLYSECPVLPASNPLPCLLHDACVCSCTFPCPDPVFRAGHCPCPLPAACAGAFSGAGKENGRKGRNTAGNYYLCSGFRRAARSRASHRELRFFFIINPTNSR